MENVQVGISRLTCFLRSRIVRGFPLFLVRLPLPLLVISLSLAPLFFSAPLHGQLVHSAPPILSQKPHPPIAVALAPIDDICQPLQPCDYALKALGVGDYRAGGARIDEIIKGEGPEDLEAYQIQRLGLDCLDGWEADGWQRRAGRGVATARLLSHGTSSALLAGCTLLAGGRRHLGGSDRRKYERRGIVCV